MTIETLMRIVPPPTTPFETYDGPWDPIEAEMGSALPQDFKDFSKLYGCGTFMSFLWVYVPRSQNPYARLRYQARTICEAFSDLPETPYPLWPKQGGLMPCGVTHNGDHLLWLTRGQPSDWSIGVWDPGFGDFELFNCDLTDFLAGLATGEILPIDYPDDLLPCDKMFEPSLG